MNKLFRMIGVIALLVGSFFYSDKVALTSAGTNTLLDKIEKISINYFVKPTEAIVTSDTFIPGKNGKSVDVQKSYENMNGKFDKNRLIFKKIEVKNKLEDNKDKFIIGGYNDKNVALLFKVDNKDELYTIEKILDLNSVKGTFFITSSYLEKNHNYIIRLMKEGHSIGNLGNNGNYNDPSFNWSKMIITNSAKQINNYCYSENKDKEILKICSLNDSYTIVPSLVINKNLLYGVKRGMNKGIIISLDVNESLEKELNLIIKYIKSKGYKIKSLDQLLQE